MCVTGSMSHTFVERFLDRCKQVFDVDRVEIQTGGEQILLEQKTAGDQTSHVCPDALVFLMLNHANGKIRVEPEKLDRVAP